MECVDGCGQPGNCECGSARELPLVTVPCSCDSEECCQESRPVEQTIEGRTHLEVTDLYNSLVNGYRHWRDTKLGSSGWTIHDEFFASYVEAHDLLSD